jgi:hypothetical protein
MAGHLKYNEGALDNLSSEPKARMSI